MQCGIDAGKQTLRAGFFHNSGYGTKAAYTASDLGIHEGDDFEILLGGDDAKAIPIPEGGEPYAYGGEEFAEQVASAVAEAAGTQDGAVR